MKLWSLLFTLVLATALSGQSVRANVVVAGFDMSVQFSRMVVDPYTQIVGIDVTSNIPYAGVPSYPFLQVGPSPKNPMAVYTQSTSGLSNQDYATCTRTNIQLGVPTDYSCASIVRYNLLPWRCADPSKTGPGAAFTVSEFAARLVKKAASETAAESKYWVEAGLNGDTTNPEAGPQIIFPGTTASQYNQYTGVDGPHYHYRATGLVGEYAFSVLRRMSF